MVNVKISMVFRCVPSLGAIFIAYQFSLNSALGAGIVGLFCGVLS